MTFQSILFPDSEESIAKTYFEMPVFFADLNLDQIIEATTACREEYNLKRLFYTYLSYLEYLERLKRAGLGFCYPMISNPMGSEFLN